MSSSVTADEDFLQAFRSRLSELRQQHIGRLGVEAVAWLALVPIWTERLAERCAFPLPPNVSLAAFLDQAQGVGLCSRTPPAARAQPEWERLSVLLRLAPYLSEAALRAALAAVPSLQPPRARAQALAELIPHLPPALLPDVRALAEAAIEPADRAMVLTELAAALPEPARTTVALAALAALTEVTDAVDHLDAATGLLPLLPEPERGTLVAKVQAVLAGVSNERERGRLLVTLLPHLTPAQRAWAQATARTLADPATGAEALVALAPFLLGQERDALLREVADTVVQPAARGRLRSDLARALVRSGRPDAALREIEAIVDDGERAYAFARLGDALGEAGEVRLLAAVTERTLRTVEQSLEPGEGAAVLVELAQHVVDGPMRHAIAEAASRLLERAGPFASAPSAAAVTMLTSLAQAFTIVQDERAASDVLQRAASLADEIADLGERCDALTMVVAEAPTAVRDAVLRRVLTAARSIGERSERVRAEANLVPYLPAAEREAVVEELLTLVDAADDGGTFWMPDAGRPETLEELRRQRGPTFLRDVVERAANAIRQAQAGGAAVPRPTARWAELAGYVGKGVGDATRRLDERLERLMAAGDVGQALAWLQTGQALAQAVGGELPALVALGQRRVELRYRQAQDRRHLEHFLERADQIAAFEQLLDGPDDRWALHYIGAGGAGKTMFLRYVAAQLATERHLAVSRVDFDHLSPDYPVLRPAQLLLELADELEPHLPAGAANSLLDSFKSYVVYLHEMLSDAAPGGDLLASLHRKDFEVVLVNFADILRQIPSPVVLIMDTCEELAKLQPAGVRLPGVEATFEILERLHALVPTLRVVFAGRRLLALSGVGWRVEQSGPADARALLPQYKDYLYLHELRGFSAAEAHDYLVGKRQLQLSLELELAILQRSPDPGPVAEVVAARPQAKETRYNPFDVSLYADWVREVPELSAREIAKGQTDPYVDRRIVGRVSHPDVRALLPAVVLLGRFDKAMVRPAFPGGDQVFAEVYRELAALEWIDYQPDAALGTEFLEVDRNLAPRLRTYFEHDERRALLDQARRSLAPGLIELVMGDALPPDRLGPDHVDAALRVLAPAEAARLWDRVARRLVDGAAWGRCRAITERLLGEEGAVAELDHPARAAVRAAYAAAMLHTAPATDVTSSWLEVAATADAHPGAEIAAWLRMRALAGRVAAVRDVATASPASVVLAQECWDELTRLIGDAASRGDEQPSGDQAVWRMGQVAASFGAALEASLELAESTDWMDLAPPAELVNDWAGELAARVLPLHVCAFGWTLVGRANALHGSWEEAASTFERATSLLSLRDGVKDAPDAKWPEYISRSLMSAKAELRPEQQQWADWRLPDAVSDRVKLEALRVLPPWSGSGLELAPGVTAPPTALEQAGGRQLDGVDAERLVSLTLQRQLARGPVPAADLEALAALERYVPDRQPSCRAHRVTPPLICTLALGWLALGEAERSRDMLNQRLAATTVEARDLSSLEAVQRTMLQVVRRMRIVARESVLVDRLTQQRLLLDDPGTAWALLALDTKQSTPPPPVPVPTVPPAVLHAWWRAQTRQTVGAETITRALQVARFGVLIDQLETFLSGIGPSILVALLLGIPAEGLLADPPSAPAEPLEPWTFESVSLWLDQEEALRLAYPDNVPRLAFDADRWLLDHPGKTEEGLRLLLRCYALDPSAIARSRLHAWASAVGPRWLAELALDEGELLTLRLPAAASRLLLDARAWFALANDAAGALIASILCTIAFDASEARMAADRLELVRPYYEPVAARAGVGVLPSWETLAAWRDGRPEAADLLPFARSDWDGWLYRLAVCLTRTPGAAEGAVSALERELRARYGLERPIELQLPAAQTAVSPPPGSAATAIAGSPAPVAVAPAAAARPPIDSRSAAICYASAPSLVPSAEGGPRQDTNGPRAAAVSGPVVASPLRASRLLLIVVGTLVVVALFFGSLVAVRSLTNPVSASTTAVALSTASAAASSPPPPTAAAVATNPETSIASVTSSPSVTAAATPAPTETPVPLVSEAGTPIASWLILVVFFAGIAALAQYVLRPALWSWQAARTRVLLSFYRDDRERCQVDFRYQSPRSRLLRPLFHRGKDVIVGVFSGSVESAAPYADRAQDIPAPVIGELAALQRALGQRRLPVRVFSYWPELEAVPWEALLTLALTNTNRMPLGPFRFWRGDPRLGPSALAVPTPNAASPVVQVLAGRTWSLLAGQGWRPLGWQVTVTDDGPRLLAEANPAATLVHLLGTPVRTASGLVLRVGADDGALPDRRRSVEATVRGAGLLLRLGSLPLTDVGLVVVQAEPVTTTARTDTDRAQAADLRLCAAQAFGANPRAVLVLPALPSDFAEQVLSGLARRLRDRWPPSLDLLLESVDEVRQTIIRWKPLSYTPGTWTRIERPIPEAEQLERIEQALDVCLFFRDITNEPDPSAKGAR